MLKKLDHPNIVKMEEIYFAENKQILYFVMQLIDGPTLQEYIFDLPKGRINEHEAKILFK